MSGDRITVSRRLWISALADAIESTEELVAGQAGTEHESEDIKKLLAEYRRAYAKATGRADTPLDAALKRGRLVPLEDLPPSDRIVLGDESSGGEGP